MDGVQFEGEQQSTYVTYRQTPKLIAWTMRMSGGAIKDERQATLVLYGFIAFCIVVSIFIIVASAPEEPAPPPLMDESFVPNRR